MSLYAVNAITPEVLARLETAVAAMPTQKRPHVYAAQLVLRRLADAHYAHRVDGEWQSTRPVDETVEQIAAAVRVGERTVKRSLAAIEAAGLSETVAHGGRGRGTRRALLFLPELGTHASSVDAELGTHLHGTGDASARTGDAWRPTPRPIPVDLPRKGAPSARRTAPSELHQRAEGILRPAWEAEHPRPQQPWPAAVKVIEKALADGWADADLTAFLGDDGFPLSGGRLDFWRKKRGNGRVGVTVTPLTAEQHAASAELHRQVRAARAALTERRAGR